MPNFQNVISGCIVFRCLHQRRRRKRLHLSKIPVRAAERCDFVPAKLTSACMRCRLTDSSIRLLLRYRSELSGTKQYRGVLCFVCKYRLRRLARSEGREHCALRGGQGGPEQVLREPRCGTRRCSNRRCGAGWHRVAD